MRANTRNVTVAIQYSWLNDMRSLGGALRGPTIVGDNALPNNNNETQSGQGLGENADTFVLSFTDVPDSTSNDRFQEVIGIAAQFALSRVARRFSLLRGLSKESFEKLPLRNTNELDIDLCSICYDGFEEELSIGLKRNGQGTGIVTSKVKRQRTNDSDQDSGDFQESEGVRLSEVTSGAIDGSGVVEEEISESGPSPDPETAESEQPLYKHSPTELPCGHIFGRDCIYRWTQEHNTCPICRAHIVENEGLNRLVPDSSAVMDEFDRQSFDRIRQLIYGEGASNPTSENGDGGITLQRHNVIVIRLDSGTEVNSSTDRDAELSSNSIIDVAAPSNEQSTRSTSNVQSLTQSHQPQNFSTSDSEPLGVIPLALFSLQPTGLRPSNGSDFRTSNTTINHPAISTTNTELITNVNAGSNNGDNSSLHPGPTNPDLVPVNNTDINRLFDLIANLTGRIQTRRTVQNPTNGINVSLPQGLSSSSAFASNSATENLFQSSNRFGLLDFLSRRTRLRNLGASNNANLTTGSSGNGDPTSHTTNDSSTEIQDGSGAYRSLFTTGVASFRDGNDVRTVDFTGELPNPSSTSSDPNPNSNSGDLR